MVLQPGESTTVSMEFMMHGDMGGKHDFRVHLVTDDPAQPDRTLTVLSNWIPKRADQIPVVYPPNGLGL